MGNDNGRGRVLFVNDDRSITLLSCMALRPLGYEVECFDTAEAGLSAFERDTEAFAAVISDMSLPGMTGLALLTRVKQRRASVPCVLTSSLLRPSDAQQAREIGAHTHGSSFKDLAALLSKLLDEAHHGMP